jgi:hypothetical protein
MLWSLSLSCVPPPPCRVAFLGYSVQALSTGEGALGSLAKFADGLNNGKGL